MSNFNKELKAIMEKDSNYFINKLIAGEIQINTIPKQLLNPQFSLLCVQVNGEYLKYISAKSRTKDVCVAAVKNNPTAIEYCVDYYQDLSMCNAAVRFDYQLFKFVHVDIQTNEMAERALSKNGTLVKYLSKTLINKSLCEAAVISKARAISCIAESHSSMLTHKLCKTSISAHPKSFRHIPDTMKNMELCHIAVSRYNKNWAFVPRSIIAQIQ